MDAVTLTRPNLALIAAFLAALSLPADAQDRPEPRPEAETPVDAAPVADPAPLTFGLAGPFLAARMATVENDFQAAARFFVQAVAHDPDDRFLQDSALVALVSAGEIDRAVALATRIGSEGEPTELSRLVHRADLVHSGDWARLLADVATPADAESEADLLAGMLRAWGPW